ncbi:MAG: hypothetical protein AAB606_03555 [Patescibacteria group bacterium]
MNALLKFAGAIAALVATLGLTGCAINQKPSSTEEQVSEEVRNIRVMLAQNTQESQWYVDERIDYYDVSEIKDALAEAGKKDEKLNFTRFPKLSNPSPTTIAIADLVMKNFKKNLNENGLKVVGVPCDSCLVVKIEFAHYEREVLKFILFIPVWQKAIAVMAKANVFYHGKMVFETSGTWERQQFKGVVESRASQEERAAAATAQRVAEEIAGLIAKTRQQLLVAR